MPHDIMIVEDHAAVRASLCDWVRAAFPQYSVVEAGSGEEPVGAAAVRHHEVVLMDLNLPRMNGIEAMRLIKRDTPEAKVVVLTVKDNSESRRRAAEAGAVFYASKSRIGSEFIPAMRRLLTPVAAQEQGGLAVGGTIRQTAG